VVCTIKLLQTYRHIYLCWILCLYIVQWEWILIHIPTIVLLFLPVSWDFHGIHILTKHSIPVDVSIVLCNTISARAAELSCGLLFN